MKKLIIFFLLFFCFKFVYAEGKHVTLLQDSETLEVVNKIVSPLCKVAGLDPRSVNVHIVIDSDINAFVTQGGELFIHTGLIAEFNDPDVLKGVVAHELGHLAGGHIVMQQDKAKGVWQQALFTTLLGGAAIATGHADAGLATIMGGFHVAQSNYLKYSREQEAVADGLAVKYLHASGSTIGGLVKLMEHFNSNELYINKVIPYMLTHPLSKERLKVVREYFLDEKNNLIIKCSSMQDKESYGRVVAKMRAFLKTEEYIKRDQKDLDVFAKSYGDVIAYYKKVQLDKSFALLDDLIKQKSSDGYLHELKGQFLLETGQVLSSVDAYKKAIACLGKDPPFVTMNDYANVLIVASQTYKEQDKREEVLNEAISILNKMPDFTNRKNPYIYRSLATAYGKLGDLGYSNLMLAEEALLLLRAADSEQLKHQRMEDVKKFIRLAKSYAGKNDKLRLKIEDINKTLN